MRQSAATQCRARRAAQQGLPTHLPLMQCFFLYQFAQTTNHVHEKVEGERHVFPVKAAESRLASKGDFNR